jgi:hypothetical protein
MELGWCLESSNLGRSMRQPTVYVIAKTDKFIASRTSKTVSLAKAGA